jgi:CIC family chloride channel protein
VNTHNDRVEDAATAGGLPVAPALAPSLKLAQMPVRASVMDRGVVRLCALAIALGVLAAFVAQALVRLIALVTNIGFFGRFSFAPASPSDNHLGLWVLLIPILGGLIVGVMARYGSRAIRGHGIPEAMEQVLTNRSKIPPKMTWLKPLSAAIAIGTGGPFGAEGPIIATGGAFGSLLGQVLHTTDSERKTLLAAGAAAGMAAIFGTPVSAVLLAIELLLFEFRPRSIIPVALAASTAAGIRIFFEGTAPAFAMPQLGEQSTEALAIYIALGAMVGVASVGVTRAVYLIEDAFEKIPVHWMWWPAIGALAVGIVGYFAPKTLGVGYSNITDLISNHVTVQAAIFLIVMKFISWSIALGSGTSGGTLAPLFTLGGGLGLTLGAAANWLAPGAHIDIRVAALVGMAAIFAGASRALLTSVVFAFETTLQPLGLLPLLGGCSASFLVSCLMMPTTIMTEKIHRRGIRVPGEYSADFLDQILVRDAMSAQPLTLKGGDTLDSVRTWIASAGPGTTHQGYPIVDEHGHLAGVLTRRDLLNPLTPGGATVASLIRRPPILVYDDCTLRDAADHMVNHDVGRLPVVTRAGSTLVGVITRSDLLSAHRRRLDESRVREKTIALPWLSAGTA